MRSREEIQEDVAISNAENNGNDTIALLQLEVLLDIRDIQKQILEGVKQAVFKLERVRTGI